MNNNGLSYIDLFAGAGGLSEGFIQSGYQPIAHVEMNEYAAKTIETRIAYFYLKEKGKLHNYYKYEKGGLTREELLQLIPEDELKTVINKEISENTIKSIFETIDKIINEKEIKNVDVIIGGPPCQAYSLVGRAQSSHMIVPMEEDPRNELYKMYVQFLTKYQPRMFVFENVAGIKTARGGQAFKNLQMYMKRVGYEIDYHELNAYDFGVLQSRKRVIIVGWLKGTGYEYPKFDIMHNKAEVWDLLKDLPALTPGQAANEHTMNDMRRVKKYVKDNEIRFKEDILTGHIARPHTAQDIEIYKRAIDLWFDNERHERLKYDTLPEKLKTHKNRTSFVDRFKVVEGDMEYCHTILAHLSKDGHYFIHPDIEQHRSITVREAARLQSFPDNYYFEGPRTAQFVQVGNAVPPMMAKQIADKIKEQLNKNREGVQMGIVESTYAELKQQELQSNPYSCLHMADIDINPHQVEAFSFALASLESGGSILADEVGLGKTIEAGLVIKFLLQSGREKILLIMPSNLRKQWQVELEEKFDIASLIVDNANWDDYLIEIEKKQSVIIVSYHFASKRKEYLEKIAWDFCVFDEAHRLRNVHKNGSKMANSLYELTKGIPKILLTATPMQNTLLDMYGLVQYIDERIFYSKSVFSERYMQNENYAELKASLKTVIQRTLRKDVAEYIQFSERKEMTIDFELSPPEIELYVMINHYLKKELLYALPNSHRTLITSVIRKLLASSSMAVAETFKVLKGRLEILQETTRKESADESIDFFLSFFDDDEIETDEDNTQDELYTREKVNEFIQYEINEVDAIINRAESISKNTKMTALKQAVEQAFVFQAEAGIGQKIVIFTESIRTQQYIFDELSGVGYAGQILKFNGNTNDNNTKQIYKAWRARNYGKHLGSRNVEIKNAIVEAFRDEYKILLVTDSGSEGLNLQFCNTIINYDLPWNPQKIEQRIGRCHRYGQKNDVVVINLLNTRNVADKRVYEILSEKFELFQGVFGASDKAIGLLESGVDFEKRVTQIYQECKTSSDFTKEFKELEKELDKKRNKKMDELKNLFIYRTEEQHKQEFEQILQEITQYNSELEYWSKVTIDQNQNSYPLYFETDTKLAIPEIMHGYLLIGGLYVDSVIETAIFELIDNNGKTYGVSDQLARTLCTELQKEVLLDKTSDNQKVLLCIDKVTEYLQQRYAISKQELIQRNKVKLSNWIELRKEEYVLKTKDSWQLDAIKEKYVVETDFRQKIELKKQIESWEQQQKKMIESFHDEMTSLEEEADNMQREFEETVLKTPQFITKIVIKF